jgi:hypothetical protein
MLELEKRVLPDLKVNKGRWVLKENKERRVLKVILEHRVLLVRPVQLGVFHVPQVSPRVI